MLLATAYAHYKVNIFVYYITNHHYSVGFICTIMLVFKEIPLDSNQYNLKHQYSDIYYLYSVTTT